MSTPRIRDLMLGTLAPLFAVALFAASCSTSSSSGADTGGQDAGADVSVDWSGFDVQGQEDTGTRPDQALDTSEDSGFPPDSTGVDAGGDTSLGIFGDPCVENTDCESGYCVSTGAGAICTVSCMTDCPEGLACRAVVNTYPDLIFLCVPETIRLCAPCLSDTQCGSGSCITIGDGEHCSRPCDDATAPCPTGYSCEADDTGSFCMPDSGVCDCNPDTDGLQRPCSVENESGQCWGYETCDAAQGWTGCTAASPAAETCNGLDDDCNGAPDDGLEDTRTCQREVTGVGTCEGTERCVGALGWICDAAEPAEEICDYLDNDCDGLTDEDFSVNGRYALDAHCGACGRSCDGTIPNADARCSDTYDPPTCVVDQCDSGYHKISDFQCLPDMATICAPCATDEGCIVPGTRCLTLDDGTFCGSPCTIDDDCPEGFGCLPYQGDPSDNQCTPLSGRCGCGEENPNGIRSCTISYQDPSGGTILCYGLERCEAGEWGACEPPAEACDSLDNDCDGDIDEDFRDPSSGEFNFDEHCGECNNDCTGLNYANGRGACINDDGLWRCGLICDDAYFDVNANPADGCECEFLSATDFPGGGDDNCDGVDGELGAAIFVARWGDDANPGTREEPKRTITTAITAARDLGKRDVYVATGVYEEHVDLSPGISVYGGYGADFAGHDRTRFETVIIAPTAAPAVLASDITGAGAPTVFADFTVYGGDATESGASSVALYVRDSDARLTLRDNRIIAGNGGGGTMGANGGDGATGVPGNAGIAATDVGGTCAGGTAGGSGGAFTCNAVSVTGGAGGDAVCPDYDEDTPASSLPTVPYLQTESPDASGEDGSGPAGGTGGSAGWDQLLHSEISCASCAFPPSSLPMTGSDGASGAIGTNGVAGVGCVDPTGQVVDGVWEAYAGITGGDAAPGSGGGGGGSGGGVETYGCEGADAGYSDFGGTGGGGGSGGCPGTGGAPGGPGGGSFGIFVVFDAAPTTLPTLAGNEVRGGRGGDGGAGGNGGRGGAGGAGAAGGTDGSGSLDTFCAPAGGDGGDGGQGGHGGGGGGGCGGASFCLYVHGATPAELAGFASDLSCAPGAPGAGGRGGASLGEMGLPGLPGGAGADNFRDGE